VDDIVDDLSASRPDESSDPPPAPPSGGGPDGPGSPTADTNDLGGLWMSLVATLPPNARAWLSASRAVAIHENTAIVAVPDDFTRTQLETRLRADLERSLSDALGHAVRLAVTVEADLGATSAAEPRGEDPDSGHSRAGSVPAQNSGPPHAETERFGSATGGQAPLEHQGDTFLRRELGVEERFPAMRDAADSGSPPSPLPGSNGHRDRAGVAETRLNPKYIFDTFVIGSSNRFAHAAAVAVAEAPGKAYNPLLIYGDSGLGKTHLLHAIGHYVRSLFDGARVRYVSSEEFTNDFINAIRDDRAASFQRRYREVDVLLIDDIQFLEGKIQTQEEFFHTFNTLHNANKQIVISSDRPPKRLEALENRLRNRFEWGLITDVQPPDLETRIAILRKKASTERLTAPPEVLEFIASKIQTNIRELEGALIRVTAFASLNRQVVDLTLAEIVLKDLIPEGGDPEVTAALIIAQTGAYFGLPIDELCGPSRSRVLVSARQIAMYLCRELTQLSLPKIGQHFGGRDHTTVMHADRKIRQLMAERRSVYNQVTELTNRIKNQARQT
jgi:chromosomal replication initiator protein